MRRLSLSHLVSERGAVATLVAVLLVPLIGFAAIAVDAGSLYAERAQLQNGADAAALAVAQKCSKQACLPADSAVMGSSVAQVLADSNANDLNAAIYSISISLSNTVDVTLKTKTVAGGFAIKHFFAGLIGITESTVVAKAQAAWGSPMNGKLFPLAISLCNFTQIVGTPDPVTGTVTGTNVTVAFKGSDAKRCSNSQTGAALSGGWGWLGPDDNFSCKIQLSTDSTVLFSTGASQPNGCSLSSYFGAIAYVPIYGEETVNRGYFSLLGIAAFKLAGYRIPGDDKQKVGYDKCFVAAGATKDSNSFSCVQGNFLKVYPVAALSSGALGTSSFGVIEVHLTQ